MTSTPSSPAAIVSVIAVCFNHTRFVVQALESIKSQTYQNIEVIILDDCSTDNSVETIREWLSTAGVDYKFVAHASNQGVCKTFNEGLCATRGKYISLLATDDAWVPEKIERQVEEMEELDEDVGVLYSDAYLMDEEGNELPGLFIERHRELASIPVGNIFSDLADGNFIPAMSTLIRRTCYEAVGRYDERLCYEDWDMWLRISNQFRFAFSDFVSAHYRIVSTSIVRTSLVTKNPARYESDCIILDKWIGTGALNRIQELKFRDRYYWSARLLYSLHHAQSWRYLLRAIKFHPGPKIFLIFVLARLGIFVSRADSPKTIR